MTDHFPPHSLDSSFKLSFRFLLIFYAILLSSLLLIESSTAEEVSSPIEYTFSLTTDTPSMKYDCIAFNGCPSIVKNAFEQSGFNYTPFKGIYCTWHPVAGNDLSYIFAAVQSGDEHKLVGAIQVDQQSWSIHVISEHFFRPDTDFQIVMRAGLRTDGTVSHYLPSVCFGTEWFVFMPTIRGFTFSYYEHIIEDPIEQINNSHIFIQVFRQGSSNMIAVYQMCNNVKNLVWSSILIPNFDIDDISAQTFPTSIQSAQQISLQIK